MIEIYGFENLKTYLEKELGIDTSTANRIFQPVREKFETVRELDEHVTLGTDGFEYTDSKGKKHKGFLFIEGGYNKQFAAVKGLKSIVPRFHILNCNTIEKQKARQNFNGHYVFSNRIEKVLDLDDIERELNLCMNCIKNQSVIDRVLKVSEYVKDYIANEKVDPNFEETDLPGLRTFTDIAYTPDWDKKSLAYRISVRFTCENCGIRLNENYYDGYYLETHHIDGNKENNDNSNLKALCILCHSEVDSIHRKNYSRDKNKIKLMNFKELYRQKLSDVNNRHLFNIF